ncbi:MAG: hypothetical protein IPP51_15090 [Bacteroidetes bacterium]|nr:hypothetical protein [Bacteroidota bacterium]
MKKQLLVLLLFLSPFAMLAQRTANIALSGGVVNYIGDLANEKIFPFSSANTGAAITLRNFLNNPKKTHNQFPSFDMQLRLSWHRLQYDETTPIGGKKGKELRNYLRGIGFRNDVFGTEADFTYNIYINRYAPLSKPRFSIFLSGGVGVFYGKPKADLFRGSVDLANRYYVWNDGTIRDVAENSRGLGNIIEKDGVYETDLRTWMTEGQGYNKEVHSTQPYSNWNIAFPLGGGIRYSYSKLITISAEFNYYLFMTDYLDDVSGRYATYDELHRSFPDATQFELAKYISDPTGQGTDGTIGPATSPRGNPGMKDSFSYISLEFAYKFTWKGKGIYGQGSN